jgi:hypothetical protein
MIGDLLKRDIEDCLSACGPAKGSPGIQTPPVLFRNPDYQWEIIKTAFIEACEKTPVAIKAWAFIERPGIESIPIWHDHTRPNIEGHCFQTGVMYLDKFDHGTIFKIDDREIIGDPTPLVWHMFSPNVVHRPPDWDIQSNVTRYVIAALAYDCLYI